MKLTKDLIITITDSLRRYAINDLRYHFTLSHMKNNVNVDNKDSLSINPLYDIIYIEKLNFHDWTIYGAVVRDDRAKTGLRYIVLEPTLTDKNIYYINIIKNLLIKELLIEPSLLKDRDVYSKIKDNLRSSLQSIIKRYNLPIKRSFDKICYYIVRDALYLGKIEPLLHDHMIEEISCDGPNIPVYVWHRIYESLPTNIYFNAVELDNFVLRLASLSGKHISLSLPILDASLPDGSRINITYGTEITKKGSTFTIRRFRSDPITIVDLIKFGTITSELAAYLWYCIEKGVTMLIAGGTASGKTTLLNAIVSLIPPNNKVVSIEDTAELNLLHENWIQSVSRQTFIGNTTNEITLFDLLRAALRQRPDIIIVGETRGREAYTLFQAMSTGHGGLSTIHADSIEGVINRLVSPPCDVPIQLIASSLDMIILQLRLRNKDGKSIRRVIQVSELEGLENNVIKYHNSFMYDPIIDRQVRTGLHVVLRKISDRLGVDENHINEELHIRRYILEYLVNKNIRKINEIDKYITEFYNDGMALYNRLRISDTM
jgi:flagellar protein FlaI